MTLSRGEIQEIAKVTADEVMKQVSREREELQLRDSIIGSAIGDGAIPLHGRETRKEPCYGCRIDPNKPLEAGNVMATTSGAIGTLSADEVRDWCSEIIETTDGRCLRVRKIREAAKRCKELHPTDTAEFFKCYTPAWAAMTRGQQSTERPPSASYWAPSIGDEVRIITGGLSGKTGTIEDIHPGLFAIKYQIWVHGTGRSGMFDRGDFERLLG